MVQPVRQPQERQVVAEATTTSADADLWGSFDEEVSQAPQQPTTNDSIAKEIEDYFEEPNIPRKLNQKEYNDPLKWWKSSSGKKYPNLRRVAFKFLIVSGTSVPSERVFR